MRTPLVKASSVALLGLTLTACAFIPDLGDKRGIPSVDSYVTEQSLNVDSMGEWPAERWWQAFGDEQLERLIEEGLRDSPTMAMARARLLRAEGLAQVAGAALQPNVALGASAAYAKPSYNTGLPTPPALHGWNDSGRIGYDASFALDFWGGNRAALAAAVGENRAVEADLAATRLLLTSAIADAYAQLSALYADRDVLERTLMVREQTLHLVARRHQYGYDSEADLRQAEAGPPTARAQLIDADERIALTRNRIAALIGAGPDRGLEIARPTARAQGNVSLPGDLRAELIGRRPDLVAARWRAEAASRRIDVAVARFRPNVNLVAAFGQQALGLDNVFATGSTAGSIGPAISLPIFDGGRRAGGYRVARAEYDAAVASYDATLSRALQEVSDALIQQRAVASRLSEEERAVTANERALALARSRFTAGAADLQSVLIAEDRLLVSQRALSADRARRLSLDIALVRALGGGWDYGASTLSTE
ncbi:efflux transporter outer membrane subunit [Steroidobacter sp. S1-65]|uniref:Efflux transporter outer membrane subunit n=1 Tax=Steroidobacter gossypii TaxID=2805490 RepID=A0ABS1X0P2_9GAMM|nr:efflux transporter outer membrane subunit [Steroidobacter gossypii]MBM0106805.1 efflux transporter outer membrane subunit [Steroidobacter gossypii]